MAAAPSGNPASTARAASSITASGAIRVGATAAAGSTAFACKTRSEPTPISISAENPRGGEVAAQYAAICALLLPSDRRSERERLLPVAEAYGVRLVPVSELENEAHAWIARQSSTAFGAIACEAPWYHRLFGARQYVPVRAVAA
jgi:hypothetical protein